MNEFKTYGKIKIGHKKLSERVEKTLEQLSTNPTASISRACGDPHQAKAVYRLLSNDKFTAESLLEVSQKETISHIAVPRDSHTKREERTAKLEIKFGKALIKKPAYIKLSEKTPITVEVRLVSAIEVEPPDGAEAISWQLITNESVNSFDDALTCVNRYMQRWKIETFHYVLKSGCAIEKLQENTAAKLIKLIALYSIVALRIMMLTYLARTAPNASCEMAFEDNEWKILYKVAKKTKSVPENPPTIFNAVITLAKLGGFLARKSDGFPGVSVIWRGLIAFYSIFNASLYLT